MKGTHTRMFRTLLFSAIACLLAGPLFAQEGGRGYSGSEDAAASPKVSAEAQAVLERMTGFMQGLQGFSVESSSTHDEVLPYGYKLQNNESAKLIVQRPNKLRSEVSGDVRDRTFVYDGSKLVI